METTILLSKVLGIVMIVSGIITIIRRKYFISLIGLFVKEKLSRLVISMIELVAGLFLLFTQYNFSTAPSSIITLTSIILIIESILYMSLPDKTLEKFIGHFNSKNVMMVGGIIAVLIGLYLTSYGFGIIVI